MRLLTRPDLDGLTCAVLLSRVESIEEVIFVEPHPLQSGQLEVRPTDIVANLPYHPSCGMWFDHHASNALPEGTRFNGAFHVDPSAARTVYNYYQGRNMADLEELLIATDKVDSAQLTLEDVLRPQGYVLLAMTLDPRTNLDPEGDLYYRQLFEWMKTDTLQELLNRPAVRWRVEKILAEQAAFEQAIREHSSVEGNVLITDFRGLDPQPVGSRFLVYAVFPQCNTSLKLYPARQDARRVGMSVGHSIWDRTQPVSAGALCARYGGGGHVGAGSCVVAADQADRIKAEMLGILQGREPF